MCVLQSTCLLFAGLVEVRQGNLLRELFQIIYHYIATGEMQGKHNVARIEIFISRVSGIFGRQWTPVNTNS